MILTKEIIDSLPVISDEELERLFVPTDVLTHNAIHNFLIGCMNHHVLPALHVPEYVRKTLEEGLQTNV